MRLAAHVYNDEDDYARLAETLVTLVGGYLMAGGANAINMFIDRDIDAHMPRTKLRPIPSGRMSPASVSRVVVAMEQPAEPCVGLDIGKTDVEACLRGAGRAAPHTS